MNKTTPPSDEGGGNALALTEGEIKSFPPFFFCNYYYNFVIFLFFDKNLLTNDKISAMLKKKPHFS